MLIQINTYILEFSLPGGSMGKNLIIFGVDIRSPVQIDKKKKDISVLGKGPTEGLDDTKLTVEVQHPINFSRSKTKSCLSLNYDGRNCFLC